MGGEYTVTVTAILDLGADRLPIEAVAKSMVLVVEEILATVDFAPEDESVSAIIQGLPVNFLASAESLSETLTYEWDFGDGSKVEAGENLTDITHVYEESGDYRLTLTVTNE